MELAVHFIAKNHPQICFLTMLMEHKSQELDFSYNFPPLCMQPNLESEKVTNLNCHDIFGYRIL